jgi:disulfide bond formation protein DsbB
MNRIVAFMTPRRISLALAMICLVAVSAALAFQHVLGYRPCPFCILQRLIFLAIAALCLGAASMRSQGLRVALKALTVLLCVFGVFTALYQNQVAAKAYSCNLSYADKILDALGVEALWPAAFQVTATCAEAAVKMLGVPFEFYALAVFAFVGIVSVWLAGRGLRAAKT